MKILFLNPKINAKHEIARGLLRKGIAVLFSETPEDALQMLEFHRDTVDLAVIHREGASGSGDPGARFVKTLKSSFRDIPIVLTTEVWTDIDCAEHQNGLLGVNAYLHSPFSENEIIDICEAVLGQSLYERPPEPSVPILQETAQVFEGSNLSIGISSINISLSDFGLGSSHLEAPQKVPTFPEKPATSTLTEVPAVSPPSLDDIKSTQLGSPETSSPDSGRAEILIETPGASSGSDDGQIERFTSLDASAQIKSPQKVPEVVEDTEKEAFEKMEELESLSISLASKFINQSVTSEGPPAESLRETSRNNPEILKSLDPLEFQSLSSEEDRPELGNFNNKKGPSRLKGSSLDFGSKEDSNEGQMGYSESTVDPQVEEEMPYLIPGYNQKKRAAFDPSLIFAEALGDAVVPGGAAQAPDLETFKKYLMLREQDVAVLSNQLKAVNDQLVISEQSCKEERAKQAELTYLANEQKKKIENFEKDKQSAMERLRMEVDELTFQLKTKTDKSRMLEKQVRETVDEMEHLKTRVRTDIRKIRARERELENHLEMNKKDSEALISARESKIIELKRKLDVLEFNMDLLQDQYSREKENSLKLRERLIKAAQVVRVAGGLLDANKEVRGTTGDASDDQIEGDEGLKAS